MLWRPFFEHLRLLRQVASRHVFAQLAADETV